MLNLDIIYIKDLKALLSYKDNRSIEAYLTKHHVQIYGDSKRKFVFKLQFERAQLQEKIQCLKNKYGNDWLKVFQVEMKMYAEHKAIIEGKELLQKISTTTAKIKPLGPQATKFLDDLQNEDLLND